MVGRWHSSWSGYGRSGIRDNKQRKCREGRHLTRGDLELGGEVRGSTYSKKEKGRMHVVYTGVCCRVQIHGGTWLARCKACESPSIPPTTFIGSDHPAEMAGVGSEAVGTPRPEAEVMPGAGNPGGVQNWFCWGSKGLAVEWCPTQNMQSARDQPKLVDEYLAEECSTGRVAGPLQPDLFPQVHPPSVQLQ